jgi:alkylated DNA repair dioxygenase AlkB
VARQLGLFDAKGDPAFDGTFAKVRRIELAHGAWIEHVPEWVTGHDALFETLHTATRWQTDRRPMYDRVVDTPRLLAGVDDLPALPILEEMRRALSARYAVTFERVTGALYRDGRDSVALHGDTTARDLPEATVATVSLGYPRRFLLRPAAPGGRALAFPLGGGDLYVMGGTCQRTWRHGIPKVPEAGPRIAIMFRPIWDSPGGGDDDHGDQGK